MKTLIVETTFDLKPDGALIARKENLGGVVAYIAVLLGFLLSATVAMLLFSYPELIKFPLIWALVGGVAIICIGTPLFAWHAINTSPVFHTRTLMIGQESWHGKIKYREELGQVTHFDWEVWSARKNNYTVYANFLDNRKQFLIEGTVEHCEKTCAKLNSYISR